MKLKTSFETQLNNNSVKLSPSWEASSRSATQIFQHFTEVEGSLPCSQDPSIEPYPEPVESSPYYPTGFLQDPF
jgi:hypothetical protein